MARVDRRSRWALDESYRYYRVLESGAEPGLFELNRSLSTLSHALYFAETGEFKLTRQLWRRLQQALFERLVTNFPGQFRFMRPESRAVVEPSAEIPEDGFISFHAHGSKRTEDIALIEISRLYPKTLMAIRRAWAEGRSIVDPKDFNLPDCDRDTGICALRPMVLGHEVMSEESRSGKEDAYQKWWGLYLQAYCTPSKRDRSMLYQHMVEIEEVWGNLYY